MQNKWRTLFCGTCMALGVFGGQIAFSSSISEYHVIWDTQTKGVKGVMPIGNGDIGANLWFDGDDLVFLIGKTDSWGDNGRLLKIGKVRLTVSPNPFADRTAKFRQELDLSDGAITIDSKGKNPFSMKFWIDANHPVIVTEIKSEKPVTVQAHVDLCRTKQVACVSSGSDPYTADPLKRKMIAEPDTVLPSYQNGVAWYHRNIKSVGPVQTMEYQNLKDYPGFRDPLLHRTFGAVMKSDEAKKVDGLTLEKTGTESRFSIYVLTRHPATEKEWVGAIGQQIASTEAVPLQDRVREHRAWWNHFWDRSWISIHDSSVKSHKGPSDAFRVAQAYNLQRYINACAGRGAYPIKFNGSIFTIGSANDPDMRNWGQGYWWQNTRLPYSTMTLAGDFDLMKSFIHLYADELFPLCEYRTEKYFGFKGAYFTETSMFWGAVLPKTYGREKPAAERKDPLQSGLWHKREWVAGPELVFMLMDYCDYTGDDALLKDKVIPIADAVISFFENYYKEGPDGKLLLYPSQALETWWNCTNAMPELAGLQSITERLLRLDAKFSTEKQRGHWQKFLAKLPALPTRNTPSGTALAPAQKFATKMNMENPELYPVFPFRLFGVGEDHIDWAKNALKHCWDKAPHGWSQSSLFMAYLGLADETRDDLLKRVKNYTGGYRFPIMWKDPWNEVPSQDHGSVMMRTVQAMLLQSDPYGKRIFLLPAWPKDWDVEFKLHAPYQTTVQGAVKNGKLVGLKVTPASRAKDIVTEFEKGK